MRRSALRIAALAASCWLCAATAVAQPPTTNPETHADQRGHALSIGGVRVSLQALLAHARRRAPALLVARARVGLAREDFGRAAPLLPTNPTLRVAAGPRLGQNGSADLNLQALLLQQIEVAGERPLRFAVARAARGSRRAELARVRWTVRQSLRAGYRRAAVERQRALLARRLVRFQQGLVDIAQRRLRAGDTSPLTLELARAEAAQGRQRSIAALQRYRAACVRLAEVSGWNPRRPPEPIDGPPAVRPVASVARLLRIAERHHPHHPVHRAAVREARARRALAEREVWPRPSLGLMYVHEGAPGGGIPEDVLMGVVRLPIPLFQQNQAARSRADAQLEVARTEQRVHHSALRARLTRLRSEVVAAAERVRTYGSNVLPRFELNLVLLRRSFSLGQIDLIRASMAVERLLRAQLDALSARAAYIVAMAALEAELGTPLQTGGSSTRATTGGSR